MAKIHHYQVILLADDMDALKEKSGESESKEALSKAVEHYLECDSTGLSEDYMNALKKKSGESESKDALVKAVEHYLVCDLTRSDEIGKRKKTKK